MDHALQHDQNPEQQKADGKRDLTNPYTNKEEERVITGSEQKTAKKLGEIKDGEVTRKDHGGTLYETKSSTSTEIKDEIIITPTMMKNVVFLLILLLFSCCSLKIERKFSEEITMARNDADIKMVRRIVI